jgi:Cu-Zn family superoxide dismutase
MRISLPALAVLGSIASMISVAVGVGFFGDGGPAGSPAVAAPNALHASAILAGPPGSGISGRVDFTQAPADADFPEPTVWVVVHVDGAAPGLHGFHIHEVGSCVAPAFTAAGGHFDAGPFGNSNPDANHPYHMGDLPNVEVNNAGLGHMNHRTSRITLSAGPLSVFDANGSAVILHLNPDQGITGAPGSGVSGGPRIACGVIVPE